MEREIVRTTEEDEFDYTGKNGQIKVDTSELVNDDGTLIFMED